MYNYVVGHAFIVYRSYVNDTLDFSGLTGGYIITNNNIREVYYERIEPELYNILPQEYVSIGNTSVELGVFGSDMIDGPDLDCAGIFFNREFAAEIDSYKNHKSNQKFKYNKAIDRVVSEKELERAINMHTELNHYNIANNNCTVVATKAWNYGLYCNDSAKYDFCRNDEDFYIITPMMLYLAIDAMPFNYEFNVREAIGLKY